MEKTVKGLRDSGGRVITWASEESIDQLSPEYVAWSIKPEYSSKATVRLFLTK